MVNAYKFNFIKKEGEFLVELTLAHWLYLIVTIIVIGTMLFRHGVVIPTLIGTLLVAWAYDGSIISGFKAVFNANLVAAQALFSIFLIITFMVALLHSLKDLNADVRMITPIQKVMTNGHISYFLLIGVTFVISLFFWPTPAVPLICALLVPAAIRAGLPAMGAAMAVAIAGQGMALSSDYIMQVAPGLSANTAGVSASAVADKALLLSLIAGGTAIAIAYVMIRKQIRKSGSEEASVEGEKELAAIAGMGSKDDVASAEDEVAATSDPALNVNKERWSKVFAVVVPISMLTVMIYMFMAKFSSGVSGEFEGGDGAAFIGGIAVLLLVLASVAYGRIKALNRVAEHITDGFTFAFRAMGPVIPIAGFFLLGVDETAGSILGVEEAPSFLFELVGSVQHLIPESAILTALGILMIGIITGLDGSGFSGLPLTGALSGAFAGGVGMDPATLAAIGQMGAIWTGGGTLIAWSSLVAVAGFCGVPVLELVRKNFIPVITGLLVATLAGVFFL